MAALKNSEIAEVFQNIAELLKRKKENPFKVRAYQKAARSIAELSVEVSLLVEENRLMAVQGIGEAINKKIVELLDSGRLEYYEKLKAEMAERSVSFQDTGSG